MLCRDVYHCTPVDLRAVPLAAVLETLATIGAENAYHSRPKSKPVKSA